MGSWANHRALWASGVREAEKPHSHLYGDSAKELCPGANWIVDACPVLILSMTGCHGNEVLLLPLVTESPASGCRLFLWHPPGQAPEKAQVSSCRHPLLCLGHSHKCTTPELHSLFPSSSLALTSAYSSSNYPRLVLLCFQPCLCHNFWASLTPWNRTAPFHAVQSPRAGLLWSGLLCSQCAVSAVSQDDNGHCSIWPMCALSTWVSISVTEKRKKDISSLVLLADPLLWSNWFNTSHRFS